MKNLQLELSNSVHGISNFMYELNMEHYTTLLHMIHICHQHTEVMIKDGT